MKNPAAVALGKLAKGKKKRYSAQEIALRTDRILAAGKAHRQAQDVARREKQALTKKQNEQQRDNEQ